MKMNDFYRASDISDGYKKLSEHKNNIVIGGGAWLKLTNKEVNTVVDLENCKLSYIMESENVIKIGGMTSLYEVETNPIIKDLSTGILSEAIRKIMGVGIKNIATIGGSVMGKYSFSDILTPLLVLNTSLVFYKKGEITLSEFLNTKKMDIDILLEIKIKKEKSIGFFKKVSKTALDFALVNVAITKGEKVKIAIGARPSISVLALEAMEMLNDGDFTDEAIVKAVEKIDLVKFSTNSKASKEYRLSVAKTYVKRGLKEVMNK